MSFGSGSMQQTLKQAGIWGCLQAAGLTAKIAQLVSVTFIIDLTCLFVCVANKCLKTYLLLRYVF